MDLKLSHILSLFFVYLKNLRYDAHERYHEMITTEKCLQRGVRTPTHKLEQITNVGCNTTN